MAASEIDIGRREVGQALVVAMVVVVADNSLNLVLEGARQIVVLKQEAVLQGLMPALDVALGLRVIGCAADVAHTLALEPFSQIT